MPRYSNSERKIIKLAENIIFSHLKTVRTLSSTTDTKDYLKMRFAGLEREVFSVLYLNSQHGLIVIEDFKQNTVNFSEAHPREIVKRALYHNASAVLLAHNHLVNSGEPSVADIKITRKLRDALGTVDIKILDHLVVANRTVVSFAERGLL